MTPDPQNPDARIDQVLNALREAYPSPGLNARIANRIAERRLSVTESRRSSSSPSAVRSLARTIRARSSSSSLFAVILNAVKDPRILFARAPFYVVAGTALSLLLAITTIALHHQTPPAAAQSTPIPNQRYPPAQRSTNTQASDLAITHAPRAISLASHPVSQKAASSSPAPTDPDAIALAETLAPSRTAPPTPLTQQELLMLAVLHSGNQQGIAALDPAKRDALLAQNELSFQNFFAPPPPPTPKTGDKE